MDFIKPGLIIVSLFILESLYFRIAKQFNIIDNPNHRSSHSVITIRGGGIIFCVGLLLCPFISGIYFPAFLFGLIIISAISFADDIKPLSNKLRIAIHVIASICLIVQLKLGAEYFYVIPVLLFFIIAVINAVNFMDGINGLTGLYALSILSPLYYLNQSLNFTDNCYLLTAILAVLVFGFFNFRKKAICFAGDVGSVSIAFIITFFLLQLIVKSHDLKYIYFLILYGLDTGTTIFFRIVRKENIGQAHRTHFYQYLANENKMPHLLVAAIYATFQLLLNFVLIKMGILSPVLLMLFVAVSLIIFLLLRFAIEGKKRLFNTKS